MFIGHVLQMTYHFCPYMNQLNSLKSLDSRNAKIFICSTSTRTQLNFEMCLVSEAHIEIILILIIIMVSNCLSFFEIFLSHDFHNVSSKHYKWTVSISFRVFFCGASCFVSSGYKHVSVFVHWFVVRLFIVGLVYICLVMLTVKSYFPYDCVPCYIASCISVSFYLHKLLWQIYVYTSGLGHNLLKKFNNFILKRFLITLSTYSDMASVSPSWVALNHDVISISTCWGRV